MDADAQTGLRAGGGGVVDEYGDPELDLDAAMAEAELRDRLAHEWPVPAPDADDAADRAEAVADVIALAWPDGTPPSVDELARDPGFADFMAAMGADYADAADFAGAADGDTDAAGAADAAATTHHGDHQPPHDSFGDHNGGWHSPDTQHDQDSW